MQSATAVCMKGGSGDKRSPFLDIKPGGRGPGHLELDVDGKAASMCLTTHD